MGIAQIDTIPRVGLIGEWLLDGSAYDTNDGTKNNGTATNVTYANTSVGYQKQNGVFNGTNAYVNMGNVNNFDYNVPFSISCNIRNRST